MTGSVALRAERSLSSAGTSAVLVAGVTLIGAALRAALLDDSLYGDELFTYEVSGRPGLDDTISGAASDLEISPPLYFVFAWATAMLGEPHVWLRIPSFIAGVAAIPVAYAVGLRTVGRPAALTGAGLLALSPFAIAYSAEARPYALALLFVLLSTLALLSAVDSGRRLHWGLFALASWAALMSHYTTVFPLAAQAGWVVAAQPHRLRPLVVSLAATAAGLLPWLPSFLADRSADFQTAIETYWPLTFSFFFRSLAGWLAGNPYVGLRGIPGGLALGLVGAGLLVALLGARQVVEALRRRETALIVAIALAAPVGAALYSLFFPSVFIPRTLLPALPALCLALGVLLTSGRRSFAAVAVGLVIAGLGVGAARLVPWSPKPPFREAAAHIDARATAGDPVLEFVYDFGALDAALTPPFALYRDSCSEPATGPLQQVRGDVRCTGRPGGFALGARRPGRRLFVLAYAGAPPDVPELERRWRRLASRTFENHFFPLEVVEYAPR